MPTKAQFQFAADIISKQRNMLKGKDKCLYELYDMCDNDEQRELIKQLLIDFHEMDEEVYNMCLLEMTNVLVNCGYPLKECMAVAMAYDHMPDSSQEVLTEIKTYLGMKGWPFSNYCNRANQCHKYYKDGIRHFFVIDDFVGSGTTIISRKKAIEQNLQGKPHTLHFVIAAGMSEAIQKLRTQGIDITCTYIMDKCISGKGTQDEISKKLSMMAAIESKLATVINQTNLVDYNLGYKKTESLYCRRNRNIPNNVLPVFWWKRNSHNQERSTLYTRVQENY